LGAEFGPEEDEFGTGPNCWLITGLWFTPRGEIGKPRGDMGIVDIGLVGEPTLL